MAIQWGKNSDVKTDQDSIAWKMLHVQFCAGQGRKGYGSRGGAGPGECGLAEARLMTFV